MVDFKINLAKAVTSTPEQRRKFYNGMLIYLALCAAGLVYTAYFTSRNIGEAFRTERQRKQVISTVSTVSGFGKKFFANPQKAYSELELYAKDMDLLKQAFGQRAGFLPVINLLFKDFPEDVAVESLEAVAARNTVSFGLVGPSKSVRAQQAAWKKNDELGKRVRSIKQVKGELRMVQGAPVYFVKFECTLK
jgi:hypothetical protein